MTDREAMRQLEALLDVPFTFSLHCRSGVLPRCECWRCRGERGEPVTDETNRLAAEQAAQADRKPTR